ncbi:DNA pilot protein [Tortoise microvirus 22]|nr:DNA pilot protein [Tortoise microvirus 22]
MALTTLAAAGIHAGIGAIGSIGSSLISNSGTRKSQKRAYRYNEMAAENAYSRQLDYWNRVNDYNLPQNVYGREIAGLRANGLSVGQFYSNGSSPGAVAGNVSAPEGSGASGTAPYNFDAGLGAGVNNFLAAQSLASQIDLNDSASSKNRAEADFYETREEVSQSQIMLNHALAGNARAQSLSVELDAQLKENIMSLTVEQARQTISLNEQLLVQYSEQAKQAVLSTRFAESSYDDRLATVTADLQDKVASIILQRVQAASVQAGIPLTQAQVQNVRSQTRLIISEEAHVKARTRQSSQSALESKAREDLLRHQIDWFDTKETLGVIDQFANYWFKVLDLGVSAATGK